jgi:acyl-coenzyme A thioesterase PaaI-like protein
MALLSPTLRLRLLALLKVPLLGSLRPVVLELTDERCVVRVRLRRWTRNHLGSMYFGTLAMGAECAGGLIAAELIRRRGVRVALVFKSFQAEFLRRPEADVYFVCAAGARIRELLERVLASGERQTERIAVDAEVRPAGGAPEPVARFQLELSLKPSEGR